MAKANFAVVAHYPITAAEEQRLYDEGNKEYPSDCYTVGEYASFNAAKAAYLRKNQELAGKGHAYAAIVDLRGAQQIEPNRYGRFEGYE